MVFIMPGMENFAPERTLSSSGFVGVAQLLAHRLFKLLQSVVHLVVDFFGNLVAVLEKEIADFGRDGEARGTGTPALHISARPAPLPPRVSCILPSPSAVPPPNE